MSWCSQVSRSLLWLLSRFVFVLVSLFRNSFSKGLIYFSPELPEKWLNACFCPGLNMLQSFVYDFHIPPKKDREIFLSGNF